MRALSILRFHSSDVAGFFFHSFSSTACLAPTRSSKNPLIFNYLIQTFSCTEQQALSASEHYSSIKTLDRPQSVVQFLDKLGFSKSHIHSVGRENPRILFFRIDDNLKPKLNFFQELGLTGHHLGEFISKNSSVLSRSLQKYLVPLVDIIKKVVVNDKENKDLICVLRKFNHRIPALGKESRLLCNIAFLESCNIVGSQLSMLFKSQPGFLLMRESVVRDMVSKILDMGFSVDSRMLVHALVTFSNMSPKTFNKKLNLFRHYGFSDDDCKEMFRRAPVLFRCSEEKLKFGIEFFLNDAKFERSFLVHRPIFFMFSMEERVLPRYRVLQVLKLKGLLKKEPSFGVVLRKSEAEFVDKFILRYRDDAEQLLVAYKKGQLLDSSTVDPCLTSSDPIVYFQD